MLKRSCIVKKDEYVTNQFTTIKGFSDRGIKARAATVLDMRLNPSKELKAVHLKAVADDVLIVLMSITVGR